MAFSRRPPGAVEVCRESVESVIIIRQSNTIIRGHMLAYDVQRTKASVAEFVCPFFNHDVRELSAALAVVASTNHV